MKAILVDDRTILISNNQDEYLGLVTLADACGEGPAQKIVELLNDIQGVEAGNMRQAIQPLFLEMHRQGIASVTVDRDGVCASVSVTLDRVI